MIEPPVKHQTTRTPTTKSANLSKISDSVIEWSVMNWHHDALPQPADRLGSHAVLSWGLKIV